MWIKMYSALFGPNRLTVRFAGIFSSSDLQGRSRNGTQATNIVRRMQRQDQCGGEGSI